MPKLITNPTRIPVPDGKVLDEYIGRVNTGTESVSVAHMHSPSGWTEPGQRPDFDEYTLVLHGTLHVEFEGGELDVQGGEAVIASKGEWVRYSTPSTRGADYVAICVPAFTLDAAHRDAE